MNVLSFTVLSLSIDCFIRLSTSTKRSMFMPSFQLLDALGFSRRICCHCSIMATNNNRLVLYNDWLITSLLFFNDESLLNVKR